MTPSTDWQHRYTTAPKNAEQALSLLSAGVGALASVELTEEERERLRALVIKATEKMW